jgi:hypothetical protein
MTWLRSLRNMKTDNTTVLTTIDFRAKQLADARAILGNRVKNLQAEIDRLRKRHLSGIIDAAGSVGQYQSALRQEIEQHPELFEKPRTITLHGIKVGFQKGKGKIVYLDAAKVCELIRTKLPHEADSLIKVTETPIKEALLNLDIATLKKLGCTVEDTGDQVVIKDAAGEIDKLVQRFLDEAAKDEPSAPDVAA